MRRRALLLLLAARDLLLSAGPLVVLVVGLVVLAFWWLDPNPPKRVVLATGPDQSAYAAFGQRYADALAAKGIELVLKPTDGSSDNLTLLRSGEADLAFVQGGSAAFSDTDAEDLVTLGNLFVEPVWLFYREQSALRRTGRARIDHVAQLKHWRVNVGTPGSGVPQLFDTVLAANRMKANDLVLSGSAHTPATVAFLNGDVDALVFASAPESPLVQMLLQTPGVRLLDFAQAPAYARRFAYLKPVVLPQGVVDLGRNVPATNVSLIAPTTSLLARTDTHPAVLQLMAQTAVALHGTPGWFRQPREYPNLAQAELPVATEALRAQTTGTPLLQRYVPFWLANLVERMWLALGLILALALPLSRIVPPLYTMRIRSRVFRWYAQLRDIERRASPGPDGAADVPTLLADLDALERCTDDIVVPLAYTDELYALRSHIQLVRKKLMRTG
ncbi:MAG: ABC transporter substrate-binding protein [Burkholderiales bacterium]|nr:ABC transporter substrate-binding protein [Burkholderiales bacterium]